MRPLRVHVALPGLTFWSDSQQAPRDHALPLYQVDPANPTDLASAGRHRHVIQWRHALSGYGGATPAVSYQTSAPYLYGDTFDACGCTVQEQTRSRTCTRKRRSRPTAATARRRALRQLDAQTYAHSPQVGWAADGFRSTGRAAARDLMKACGSTMTAPPATSRRLPRPSSQDEYVYRYHTTGEAHEANTEAQCAAPNPWIRILPLHAGVPRGLRS